MMLCASPNREGYNASIKVRRRHRCCVVFVYTVSRSDNLQKVMGLTMTISPICLFNIIRKPSLTKRNTLSLCWSYRLDIFFAVNYLLSDKGFLHGFTQEAFVVIGHVFCPLFYNSLLLCLSHHCLIYKGVKHGDSNAI